MFCKNCGREIDSNAAFCPGCGNRIQDMITTMTTASSDAKFMSKAEQDNQYLIQAIGSLLSPLEQIGNIVKQVEMKNRALSSMENNIKKHTSRILFIFIGLFVGFFIAGILQNIFNFSNGFAFVIMFSTGIPIGIVLGKFRVESLIKQINDVSNKRDQMLQNLEDICKTINPEYMHLIPRDYRHIHACQFFYNAFLNGRAMSMQQAVNLYEEELHRSRMEKMQLQQVAQLKSIRTSSNISAAASTANLFINLFG